MNSTQQNYEENSIWIQPIQIARIQIEFDSIQLSLNSNCITFNWNFNENTNHLECEGEKYCV